MKLLLCVISWPSLFATNIFCVIIHKIRPSRAVGNVPVCRSRDREFNISILVEIDHELISTAILLPSADSRKVVVSYKQEYVHEVLVNCLVKLAQKKLLL